MKKVIALMIAVLLTLTTFSLTAYAGEEEPEQEPDLRFISVGYENEKDSLILRVLYEGVVDNTAVEGVVYDSDTNTLTVTDVDAPEYTLEFGGLGSDFKLIVKGECAFADIAVYAWVGSCSVYIGGDGKLTLNEQKNRARGITAYFAGMKDTVTFGEDVTVEMYGEENTFTIFNTGYDTADDAVFFNASHTAEPELKTYRDQYFQSDMIKGYYIDPFNNLKGYWLGYRATVPEDPDGIYTAAYGYNADPEGHISNEFYVIYRYVYSEELGMYFYDTSYNPEDIYGMRTITLEEFENGAVSFMTDEYGDYVGLYNSEDFSRAFSYSVFKDGEGQLYAVGDEYDVSTDSYSTVVALFERIPDIGSDDDPEYIFTLTDVDPDTLEYVEDSELIKGYYLGGSEFGYYHLGYLVGCKDDPDGVYTVSASLDTDEETGEQVLKYEVYHYILGSVGDESYWLRDHDFNKDGETWERHRIILSEDEFTEKYHYLTDGYGNYLILFNMRDIEYSDHFRLFLDDQDNKYGAYNYNGDEYFFSAAPFDGEMEGLYWMTLVDDVDPTALTESGKVVYEDFEYHHVIIEGEYFGYNVGSASEEKILGDVDGDGAVTILDATAIQRKLADMEVEAYDAQAADVDSADGATVLDVTAIQKYLADFDAGYPIGQPIGQAKE